VGVNRDRVFFALSDQTRWEILNILSAGKPLCLAQVARCFSHSVPGTLKHLQVLLEAGLIRTVIINGSKGYTFEPGVLSGLLMWLDRLIQKQENARLEPISFEALLRELDE
jgi:DNA-binding transcriptional ArsR family regulator